MTLFWIKFESILFYWENVSSLESLNCRKKENCTHTKNVAATIWPNMKWKKNWKLKEPEWKLFFLLFLFYVGMFPFYLNLYFNFRLHSGKFNLKVNANHHHQQSRQCDLKTSKQQQQQQQKWIVFPLLHFADQPVSENFVDKNGCIWWFLNQNLGIEYKLDELARETFESLRFKLQYS